MTTIYTIGHSTRTEEEFLRLVKNRGIEQIIDVRSAPTSKHAPQYNHWEMKRWLNNADIIYTHIPELGGHRPKPKDVELSTISGWTHPSFSNYAGYMQSEEFDSGIKMLIEKATKKVCAYMCSESKWWQCHRRMISDQLVAMNIDVQHIMTINKDQPHQLTKFAIVEDEKVLYPSIQLELAI